MLIKRKVKEVPETEEEKKDKEYKKMRNVGLASLGTGALVGAIHAVGAERAKDPKSTITKKDLRVTGLGSAGLLGTGAGLVGYAGIKRKNLKKKVKEEREKKDDNNKE